MLYTVTTADNVAAVLLESIQGEGGFIVPPDEFIQRVREICNKNNIIGEYFYVLKNTSLGEIKMTHSETANQEFQNLSVEDKEGKYLTFALGAEEYGLEILKVREIIGYMDITSVPQTPPHVKGVLNLRGQVIPVVDLRLKFGMEEVEVTDQTCIIVVEIDQGSRQFQTGIIVDNVSEVLDITRDQIEDAPAFGSQMSTDFILGMAKMGESVKILLDIDKVLGGEELDKLT